MRLRSISLRGITCFTGAEPVTMDFDQLGPGLVALVGANGQGKTTCLEATPAALFKNFPSRPGSLYDSAHGRDAFIEAVFDDDGRELTVRLAIDAERRTTEGYLFEDGRSLTTGRAAEFEAEVERRFGSLALFLSSVFAAQNKAGNFLTLKKVDRKSLFVELLGLGALEVLHEAARGHETTGSRTLDDARRKVADVETETADLPVCEAGLVDAQQKADAAAGQLDTARTEEAAALAALERARGAAERLTALESAEAAASRELEAAEKALKDARALGPKAEADAKTRLRFVDGRKVGELEGKAHTKHAAAMARFIGRREQLEAALKDVPDWRAAADELELLTARRTRLEAEVEATDKLRKQESEALAGFTRASDRLGDAKAARALERERLERQAGLLPKVPCTSAELWVNYDQEGAGPARPLAGACPLLADARGAKEQIAALQAAGPLPEEAELEKATDRLAAIQTVMVGLEATDADRRKELKAIPREDNRLRLLILKAEAAVTARKQLSDLAVEVDEELQRHTVELADALEKMDEAASERRQIESDLADALFVAEEKVKGADQLVRAARAYHYLKSNDLDKERGQTVSLHDAGIAAVDRKADRQACEQSLRDADTALARCRAQVEVLRDKAATLPALRDAVTTAERELGDWSLLARALGKDGVQALEIDAAGPEVARLTNELLESCYGPRFSISFETLREKKSARGEFSEAFDVRVYDAGAERPVEALSGGERVVVGEAIGLAISIFNARKSGIRWHTLFRDETAGALDPENAQAYVLMLRRALALGGFHQVLFVSHSPEVWEAADVRLVVAGGRVSVEAEARAA